MKPKVLEYLEFTQLSNFSRRALSEDMSFRVLGIYTALKPFFTFSKSPASFRVLGIYTALKRSLCQSRQLPVLEYLEFTQLSNLLVQEITPSLCFRVLGIYTALKHVGDFFAGNVRFRVLGIYTALKHMDSIAFRFSVLEYLEFTQLSNW